MLSPILVFLFAWPGTPTPVPAGISFEKNLGQAPGEVRYLARIPGAQVFFTGQEVVFASGDGDPVRLRFPGSAANARWEPAGSQRDSISYFLGSDPAKWVR